MEMLRCLRRRNMHLTCAVLTVLVLAACGGLGEDAVRDLAAPATPTGVPSAPTALPATVGPSPSVAAAAPTATQVPEPEVVVPSSIGSLLDPRGGWHTATLLRNGRVLVTGGLVQPPGRDSGPQGWGSHLKSAETYDPSNGTWTLAGSMTLTRAGHGATLLDDGTVLVVGGLGPEDWRASAEVYNPSTDSWARAGMSKGPTAWHAATRLSDGRVLVAGGYVNVAGLNNGPVDWAEIYDAATGTWSTTGSMGDERLFHTLTFLDDGRVLAAGGSTDLPAEVYDPSDGTWTQTSSLREERRFHTATLHEDGTVLLTGGMTRDFEALQSAEIYDPAGGAWSLAGSMSEARAAHTATRLTDGRVLVAGGLRARESDFIGLYVSGPVVGSAEVYDPSSGTWSPVGSMSETRAYHSAVLLEDGRVLVIGGTGESAGEDYNILDSTELFDPSTETWSSPGSAQ